MHKHRRIRRHAGTRMWARGRAARGHSHVHDKKRQDRVCRCMQPACAPHRSGTAGACHLSHRYHRRGVSDVPCLAPSGQEAISIGSGIARRRRVHVGDLRQALPDAPRGWSTCQCCDVSLEGGAWFCARLLVGRLAPPRHCKFAGSPPRLRFLA
eukprot:8040677-Alexandrium_andersonii.AAC.1